MLWRRAGLATRRETTIKMLFLSHKRLLLNGLKRNQSLHGACPRPPEVHASIGSKESPMHANISLSVVTSSRSGRYDSSMQAATN
jgi:hypothetical protein